MSLDLEQMKYLLKILMSILLSMFVLRIFYPGIIDELQNRRYRKEHYDNVNRGTPYEQRKKR